jgi:predicted adenylyl cyclase CyaB
MGTIEVEVKTLLGEETKADEFRNNLFAMDPKTTLIEKNSQLNHYFVGGDVEKLKQLLKEEFHADVFEKLEKILEEGHNHSVRTRQKNEKVFLVVKASIDDTTSENGIARLEFEEQPDDLSLNELDTILIDAGFEYQAKWSRAREEYKTSDSTMTICVDKNAGYGYLAEFEKVVEEGADVQAVRREIDDLMARLGVEELTQERLGRMFDFYNRHWPEYYGTEKVFVVE